MIFKILFVLLLFSFDYEDDWTEKFKSEPRLECLVLKSTKKELCIDLGEPEWLIIYHLDETLRRERAYYVERIKI